MGLPTRPDHRVIHVSDGDRSTAFHRDVPGAGPVPVGKGFADRFGDTQLYAADVLDRLASRLR